MSRSRARGRLLVVDDDRSVVEYLVEMCEREGFAVEGVTSPRAALELAREELYDLVIADIEMPELRGPDLLEALHAIRPAQLVIFITAFGSLDLAVQMVRAGASDFIAKPFKIEALLLAVERALRERRMRHEIVRLRSRGQLAAGTDLVANSPAMRRVVELASRIARTDTMILVTGESGSGKGALARFVHERSPRAAGPLVEVNCAALPAPLVEAELFGVKQGAFTDARQDRPGLFVQADGGTLVLDEVGEMPLESQPKLLQALESSSVRPVGGSSEVRVDVRVIAATNRALEEALRERRFRPDLYYRLNVIRLEIPPLRDRPEDIEGLVDRFFNQATARQGRLLLGISAEAMRCLLAHDWPGNVRELSNVIERAVALAEHDTIIPDDLSLERVPPRPPDLLEDAARLHRSLAELERSYVRKVVEVAGGNKSRAARILDIDRRTLYRKLQEARQDDARQEQAGPPEAGPGARRDD